LQPFDVPGCPISALKNAARITDRRRTARMEQEMESELFAKPSLPFSGPKPR
jgi:hypothetical protein